VHFGIITIRKDKTLVSAGSKAREVVEEFRTVAFGRGAMLDAILPGLAFLLTNALRDSRAAMLAAVLMAGALTGLRAARRQPLTYALLGLGAAALAFLVAQATQRAEVFFLPDLITNAALFAASLASIVLKRPLVAWTSLLARRWPRGWYWHPRIRPAYTEVTLAWALFFLLQGTLQWAAFQQHDPALQAAVGLISGWPATVALLIPTYVYGTWRLARLAGPSVAEFRAQTLPPWTGQRRGF
jgi:hypothetical protein